MLSQDPYLRKSGSWSQASLFVWVVFCPLDLSSLKCNICTFLNYIIFILYFKSQDLVFLCWMWYKLFLNNFHTQILKCFGSNCELNTINETCLKYVWFCNEDYFLKLNLIIVKEWSYVCLFSDLFNFLKILIKITKKQKKRNVDVESEDYIFMSKFLE